eukprot:gene20211-14694_t
MSLVTLLERLKSPRSVLATKRMRLRFVTRALQGMIRRPAPPLTL